jgi:hypothetical protein
MAPAQDRWRVRSEERRGVREVMDTGRRRGWARRSLVGAGRRKDALGEFDGSGHCQVGADAVSLPWRETSEPNLARRAA